MKNELEGMRMSLFSLSAFACSHDLPEVEQKLHEAMDLIEKRLLAANGTSATILTLERSPGTLRDTSHLVIV